MSKDLLQSCCFRDLGWSCRGLLGRSWLGLAVLLCPRLSCLHEGNDWTAQKRALTQFTAQSVKIMPVGAAWLHQLLPPLCHYWAGGDRLFWALLLQICFPTVIVNSITVLEMDGCTTAHRELRSPFLLLSALARPWDLTYVLKILHLQFGCSWLCCALHQSPASLCHRTGDLSAGEVSHCWSLTQILR